MVTFLAVTGAVVVAGAFNVHFGDSNFWDHHGLLFLVGIAIFPRLTLLISSVPFGGLFWWAGFFFAPRLLVAFLATLTYWNQNPFLVVLAWIIALGGESSEKTFFIRQSGFSGRSGKRGFDSAQWVKSQ